MHERTGVCQHVTVIAKMHYHEMIRSSGACPCVCVSECGVAC